MQQQNVYTLYTADVDHGTSYFNQERVFYNVIEAEYMRT